MTLPAALFCTLIPICYALPYNRHTPHCEGCTQNAENAAGHLSSICLYGNVYIFWLHEFITLSTEACNTLALQSPPISTSFPVQRSTFSHGLPSLMFRKSRATTC